MQRTSHFAFSIYVNRVLVFLLQCCVNCFTEGESEAKVNKQLIVGFENVNFNVSFLVLTLATSIRSAISCHSNLLQIR